VQQHAVKQEADWLVRHMYVCMHALAVVNNLSNAVGVVHGRSGSLHLILILFKHEWLVKQEVDWLVRVMYLAKKLEVQAGAARNLLQACWSSAPCLLLLLRGVGPMA
jgi:hypothetical protein